MKKHKSKTNKSTFHYWR